ncbi:hypothetical protein GIB67_018440, partial [Kingdonia uniflora]
MQNLTMLLEEEEYDGTGDEKGSESDYSEGHVSQLRFLSGKKCKNNFEEVVNASIEPPSPLPQNYEARDFWQLTQLDGKGHLSTSVATTSARVGFKCRSVLVKLHEIYVILIAVPHLKQRLKATNLISVFDYKIGNVDNQVILAMIERWWPATHTFCLPCGDLGITPRDFTVLTGIGIGTEGPMEFDESSTDYGNAIRDFPDMMSTYYEKGCISFAHLRMFANGVSTDSCDEYSRVAESTAIESLTRFCNAMIGQFGAEYLRSPTPEDIQRLLYVAEKRRFPCML